MTLQSIKKALTWQAVTVIVAGGILYTVLDIWGSPATRTFLVGANGLAWTIVAYFMRAPKDRR